MKKFNFISLNGGVIVKITLLFCVFYLQNSFAQWCGSHHVTDRLIAQIKEELFLKDRWMKYQIGTSEDRTLFL